MHRHSSVPICCVRTVVLWLYYKKFQVLFILWIKGKKDFILCLLKRTRPAATINSHPSMPLLGHAQDLYRGIRIHMRLRSYVCICKPTSTTTFLQMANNKRYKHSVDPHCHKVTASSRHWHAQRSQRFQLLTAGSLMPSPRSRYFICLRLKSGMWPAFAIKFVY